jgi:hypothetical protein
MADSLNVNVHAFHRMLFHADIHLLDQLAPFGNFGLDMLAELLSSAADWL